VSIAANRRNFINQWPAKPASSGGNYPGGSLIMTRGERSEFMTSRKLWISSNALSVEFSKDSRGPMIAIGNLAVGEPVC
jgi:hypothetical protein